jgi:hypothetical protein
MRTHVSTRAALALIALLALPLSAAAQGALTNGANHSGTVGVPGEFDQWTFTAAQGDTFIVSIGEVPRTPDSGFVPWIEVLDPLGAVVPFGSQSGQLTAQVEATANLTGTYEVLVRSNDAGRDAVGDYVLTLAKAPGAFAISGGDEGGSLANGLNHTGRIGTGDLDMWSFSANQGDTAVVAVAEIPVAQGTPDPGFVPWIRVYNSLGGLVAFGSQAGPLAAQTEFTAALTGVYTVVVGTNDGGRDATGDYLLTLAKVPGPFNITIGDDGGPLANGANQPGRIEIGDLDMWSFSANQGDTVIVGIGEVPVGSSTPDPGFFPWIRVYGPTGDLLPFGSQAGDVAAQTEANAPLTGIYTVIVSSNDGGRDAAGDYLLRLVRVPAAFTVPANDQGGALSNGANHVGRIVVGDLDIWTFDASQGDTAIVGIGELPVGSGVPDPGFVPWIRVYDPLGDLVPFGSQSGALAGQVEFDATLAGTYTVVVGTNDGGRDAEGDYVLTVARIPGTFSVTAGDHGGTIVGSAPTPGRIEIGDLDLWTFSSCQGQAIVVTISEVPVGSGVPDPGFFPWIRVYNPTGSLVPFGSQSGNLTAQVSTTANLTGVFTIVVGTNDGGRDATGDYTVAVNGVCTPSIPPAGVDDSYTTAYNTPLVVPAPGVMANDLNVSGATAALLTGVNAGSLSFNADGSFTYTPPNGFSGQTSFSYRAANASGLGTPATVTIDVGAPPPSPVPTGLYAWSIVDNIVTLRWTAPTLATPSGYFMDGGVAPNTPLVSIPTGRADTVFVFSAPSGSFFVRVRAVVNGQLTGPSNEIAIHVNVPVPPSPPKGLTGTVDNSAVTLSWRNTFAGGPPQQAILDVSGTLSGSVPLGPSESFTFNPIPNGTYTFSVRSTNAGGVSASSNAVTLTFPLPCTGAPQEPEQFLAFNTGNLLTVFWDPPTSGPAPSHYLLAVSGAVNVTVPFTTRGLTLPVPPGTYTFSVAAVNTCGTSAFTASQTVTIP